ncbi:O-methyltransferase [Georgenia sp. Z1491]|uniref:O-methyltransferase n=1 Tax=Georgenia sp. Z1491 TaxID=3416707 RepID=UPI003CF85AA4
MSVDKAQSWAYAEEFVPEEDVIAGARARSEELGVTPVSPGTGAVLRLLAATVQARVVAEIGTGTGVSGLWLLSGMPADGVLTTIDVEGEYQRSARESFLALGVRPARTRLISGRALDVVPRLADGAYDLVHVDGDPAEAPEAVEQSIRLLRPGGVLVVSGALSGDRVADPARRDDTTVTARELVRSLREDERLLPTLLTAGTGVVAAVRI